MEKGGWIRGADGSAKVGGRRLEALAVRWGRRGIKSREERGVGGE